MNIVDLLALTGLPYALAPNYAGDFEAFGHVWTFEDDIARADSAGWHYHRESLDLE